MAPRKKSTQNKEFFEAILMLEKEKGIPKEVLINSLCDALVAAYKKQIKDKEVTNVEAIFDELIPTT